MSRLAEFRSKRFGFSTLLIIFIVIESQYIIESWVVGYGNNKDVVSNISFAGTIVSIILAVLAIVYSYYQNFSQQRDAYNIASQIEMLRQTVGLAENSGREFLSAVGRLEDISDKIDKNIVLGEASHALLKVMNESNKEKRSSLDAAPGDVEPTDLELSKLAKRFVDKATVNQLAIYYMIVKGAESETSLTDLKDKTIEPIFGKKYRNYYRGFMQCAAYMLLDLRIVRLLRGDSPFTISSVNESFKRLVVDEFESLDRSDEDNNIDIDSVVSLFKK